MLDTSDTDFVKLLKLMYNICDRISTHGIMSLSDDIASSNFASVLFMPSLYKTHPETMERLRDLLRFMQNKDIKLRDLKYFWKQSTKCSALLGKNVNPYHASVNDCVWSTMRALIRGYSPDIAIEFCRGSILTNQRISAETLAGMIKAYKQNNNSWE